MVAEPVARIMPELLIASAYTFPCAFNSAAAPVIVQAPIYPVTDDVSKHQSFRDFASGYLLTSAAMAWFTQQYGGDPADPRLTPMAGEVGKAPPTVLCTAGLDPLRDSGRAYAAHLIGQGTDVTYLEFPGIIHGFTTLRKAMPSAQQAIAKCVQATVAR